MTDHDIHGCGRAGAAMGVLCAFFGAVTAAMIVLAIGLLTVSTIPSFAPPVGIGLIGLFVGAGFFGSKAGVFLCENGNQTAVNVSIGVLLAYGSICDCGGDGNGIRSTPSRKRD
jgi:hypothetical protein